MHDETQLSPAAVLAADPAALRGCGLSERKASYLQELATHFQDGRLSDGLLTSEQAGGGSGDVLGVLRRAWTAAQRPRRRFGGYCYVSPTSTLCQPAEIDAAVSSRTPISVRS